MLLGILFQVSLDDLQITIFILFYVSGISAATDFVNIGWTDVSKGNETYFGFQGLQPILWTAVGSLQNDRRWMPVKQLEASGVRQIFRQERYVSGQIKKNTQLGNMWKTAGWGDDLEED